ncbi:GNAT family N-acetyltransferase [Halobacillus litoralis]|uniref:GNAT family N-acetyltransferase n=1 Tax=Halobacillus litoralis TaxID=45668 RepID=A0A845DLI9_9BACI|nr:MULTISPECIES: GNAT family N-acetyltransferase [Halobacillus]MCA1022606.1 GNAT family N-acetyltransferase [Halobacillus litoralis]MYL18350.1 GNAT family N-acetyltransferase [Halobacillus litoralis]MYL30643.1 GNAT family N-acetyltransferase [Halobacillus halophilus]MYL38660.1 GNAT family N-acetyltransferase [Halobacillus litoralis]
MPQVREARFEDAATIADIHVKSWKSTYKDLIDERDISNTTLEHRITLWETILRKPLNGQIAFVIENDEGQVVGFVSGGKERTKSYGYDGEIYAIYLLDEYQGKGYGRILLQTFVRGMAEAGYQSLLVWVLTRNPSSRFYIKYGADPVEAEKVTIGQGTYEETAYGWKDLHTLSEALKA